MKTLRIGTRESRLAMIQARLLREYLQSIGVEAELVTMKTTGDRILDRRLDQVGGKGLFVRELDLALLEGRTDVSVHSAKDLPMELPEELPVLGWSRRADPRDVLVLPPDCRIWDRTLPVGCASGRRMLQLQALYPDARFETVRGNVLTRLQKLDSGRYGALILAAAGLHRLGLEHRISRYFSPDEMIPAAGQGILCVQGRRGGDYDILRGFFDETAALEIRAERAFVSAVGGGCSSPTAAFAQRNGDTLLLRGLYADEARGIVKRGRLEGPAADPEHLGQQLARQLSEGPADL